MFQNGNSSSTCDPIDLSTGCDFKNAVSLATPSWQDQSTSSTDSSMNYEVFPPASRPWVDPDQNRPVRASVHMEFIKTVGHWVGDWARNDHRPFIHSELYADRGTPNCLQDAFACLAAYQIKTNRIEEITWQLVERTADELFQQNPSESGKPFPLSDSTSHEMETVPMGERLPLVQAGFLIIYIRLFDEDIRQRSLAEAHMGALLSWLKTSTAEADLFCPRLNVTTSKLQKVRNRASASTDMTGQWQLQVSPFCHIAGRQSAPLYTTKQPQHKLHAQAVHRQISLTYTRH